MSKVQGTGTGSDHNDTDLATRSTGLFHNTIIRIDSFPQTIESLLLQRVANRAHLEKRKKKRTRVDKVKAS
jgi:hypothetical protein